MPELPELEIIKDVLQKKIVNVRITDVQVKQPIVLRCTIDDLTTALNGSSFIEIQRKGKFILLHTNVGHTLVINPMLTGKFQLVQDDQKLKPKTCIRIQFENQKELRYFDSNLMGKIYLVQGDFSSIPKFIDMGPEANDENMSLLQFQIRLRKHRGIVKNVLTNHKFLAGIGNAYADETLFVAGILPNRSVTRLQADEIERLYTAVRSVLSEAIDILRQRVSENIEDKIRDFLRVHNKGGQVCPQCDGRISEIRANQRITSFCRNCQK